MPRGSTIKPKKRYVLDTLKIKMDILYSRYVELTKGDDFPALNCACGYKTSSVKKYQRHLLLEHLELECDENNQVPCPHCNEIFKTSCDYRDHFEKAHPNTSRVSLCVLCKFVVCSSRGNHGSIVENHLFRFHRENVCGIGERYDDAIFIRRTLKENAKKNKVIPEHRDNPSKCSNIIHKETNSCSSKMDDTKKDILRSIFSFQKHRVDRQRPRLEEEKKALSQQMSSCQITEAEKYNLNENESKEIHCMVCRNSFSHKVDLKIHLVMVHVPIARRREDDEIPCQHCQLHFEQEKAYLEHLSSIHDKRGLMCCPHCSFTGDKAAFAEHGIIHRPRPGPSSPALSDQLTLNGDECNSRSPDLPCVKVDTVTAVPSSEPKRLPETASKSNRKRRLSETGDNGIQPKNKMHKEEHIVDKKTILTKVKAIKQKEGITCPFCPCSFSNIGRNLFTHLVTAHLETERTPDGVIQCSRCTKTFEMESSYRLHFKKHNTGSVGCRQCPFKDADRYNATNHFIETHFKELTELSTKKALTNKINSKVFLDIEAIRCRLAKELAVTKPLKKCPFCVYTNESQRGVYNLRQHILVSHLANERTPVGKIQCPHCFGLFNSDPDFRKHLKKEQSGKGMFCPHCNYVAKSHDLLNSHIRNGHYEALMPEILLGIPPTQASCNRPKI